MKMRQFLKKPSNPTKKKDNRWRVLYDMACFQAEEVGDLVRLRELQMSSDPETTLKKMSIICEDDILREFKKA